MQGLGRAEREAPPGKAAFSLDRFPFGVLEHACGEQLTACRHVFGSEPRDAEVWAFILRECDRLKFSTAVRAEVRGRAYSAFI